MPAPVIPRRSAKPRPPLTALEALLMVLMVAIIAGLAYLYFLIAQFNRSVTLTSADVSVVSTMSQ
jgi:hypothetical protein